MKTFFEKLRGISAASNALSSPARVMAITSALVTPHPYVGLVVDAESPIARKLPGRYLYPVIFDEGILSYAVVSM